MMRKRRRRMPEEKTTKRLEEGRSKKGTGREHSSFPELVGRGRQEETSDRKRPQEEATASDATRSGKNC